MNDLLQIALSETSAPLDTLQLLLSILSTTTDCIELIDLSGKTIWLNAYSQSILPNKNAYELLHKPWVSLWHGNDLVLANQAIAGALAGNRTTFVGIYPTEQGPRWWDTTMSPVFDADNKVIRLLAVSRDVTDQHNANHELERARDAATEASTAKSLFLANMSHEIRTPLNGVVGMTELLLATHLTAEQRKYAECTKTSAHALLTLINDILDLSKIEAGKLELAPTEFNLHNTVDEAAALLYQRATDKKIKITAAIDAGIPNTVIGDPDRLRQILLNLVGNAVKFTSKGSVTIHLSQDDSRPVNPLHHSFYLQFSIIDTGIGIPPDRLDRLFKNFSQVDATTTRKFGGTGLGLAISKQLIELMGGSISVTSAPNVGTTFTFTLKLHYPNAKKQSAPAPRPAPPPTTHRVLVAEDNEINRMLVEEILRQNNFQVTVANDGQAALAAAQSQNFDLILMDCQMPIMDGFEATAAIRNLSSQTLNRTPIIALTANAIKGDRERCLAAGMDNYLTKPLNPKNLIDTIRTTLSNIPSPADNLQLLRTAQATAHELQSFIGARPTTTNIPVRNIPQ